MSEQHAQPPETLTLERLLAEYEDIHLMLNAQWPLESQNERVFARTLKLMEELGELSNEILTMMGLQRQAKVEAFREHHLEDELADVLGSLLLLAVELDIDIPSVMRRKIDLTNQRLQAELENE